MARSAVTSWRSTWRRRSDTGSNWRSRIDRDGFWLGAAIEHGRDDAVAAQALGQLLAGALAARDRQFLRLHVRSFRRTGSRPIPRRECVGWPHRAAEPP